MKTSRAVVVAALALALAGFAVYQTLAPKAGADPADARQVALGERAYGANCAACHGVNLEGAADWRTRNADGTLPPPPHDERGHTWHHPDRVLFDYTKGGGQALAPPGFASAMPGFAGTLSDAEIWAALAFIKSRWPPAIRERQRRIDARSR